MPIFRLGRFDSLDVPELGISISLSGSPEKDHVDLDIRKLGELSEDTKAMQERFFSSGGHSDTPYSGND